jgi:molybdate transport system substrate-binding protein
MEEIELLYQQKYPNVVINSIFAGSGLIKRAIERGEPFDGVIFAEESSLNQLETKGLILPKSRNKILTSDLVLIALADSPLQVSSFKELADNRIKSVAIGNKDLGVSRYTNDLLNHLGINEIVKSKAIFSTGDVRDVLRAVEQGDAEVGITFLSEAKGSSKVKILATAPRNLYEPIRCVYAIIKTSAHPQEMEAYFNFLSSDRARAVFKKFGLFPLS